MDNKDKEVDEIAEEIIETLSLLCDQRRANDIINNMLYLAAGKLSDNKFNKISEVHKKMAATKEMVNEAFETRKKNIMAKKTVKELLGTVSEEKLKEVLKNVFSISNPDKIIKEVQDEFP